MKQFYGFTPAGPLPGQSYVPFLQAFKHEDGKVEICVRNTDGKSNSILISPEEALSFSLALGASKFASSR